MRVKDYSTLKSASKVAFSKDGDVVSLTEKKFNSSTGEALSDVVHEVELSHYKSKKSHLESEKSTIEVDIAELAKIITDIEAL
tara:strand:- start:259 stop:507 length:249 start_codon:yes stop_codon:yes gene_type:complete